MSEWIKTSERLPTNLSPIVSLYYGKPYISEFSTELGFYILFDDDTADYFSPKIIKYWMPIPRIPADA